MKVRGFSGGPKQTSIERSYELEEILFRIHRGVRFPLRVRLPLVRNVNARAHHEVPTLLRPEADFKSYFGWLALGQFVMAFFFTLLCARYVPNGRAGAGAMLGLLVGLVYAGPHLISFAVQPLTFKILFGWIAGAVIQFTIAGAIVGAIYKPATAHLMYVGERSR